MSHNVESLCVRVELILDISRRMISKLPKEDQCSVSNYIENIQLWHEYAEPGYSSKKGIIALGNWNKITRYSNKNSVRETISNIPVRIANLFDKMGIDVEWEDEWTSCSECGKLVRTQPDSWGWKPSYVIGEAELFCLECAPKGSDEE